MPEFTFPCLKLKQRDTATSPTAILFAAPASEVTQWASIQRRSQTAQGTQRKLSKAKVNAIKRFFLGDDRNTIPAAVVVTLTIGLEAFTNVELPLPAGHAMKDWVKILKIEVAADVTDEAKPGIVLDGQHRLLGMKQYPLGCMVNVVALLNVDDMEKAFQFLVINNKAAKVSGDLIRTLGLDYKEAELSKRLQTAKVSLHDNLPFVGYADTEAESPFKGTVALVAEDGTQAQRFVPPSAIESSVALIQGKKVRELDDDDALCEFFYSIWRPIKAAWPDLWNRDSKLMNKVGIIAMTSYMAEALISRFDFSDDLDITDSEQLEKLVQQFLLTQTPEFWKREWKPSSYDTRGGRELVIQSLTRISRNMKSERPWAEDVDIIL